MPHPYWRARKAPRINLLGHRHHLRQGDTESLQGVTASRFFKITAADRRGKTNPVRNFHLSWKAKGERECVEGKNIQIQRRKQEDGAKLKVEREAEPLGHQQHLNRKLQEL